MREGVRRIRVSRGTAQVVHQTKGGKAASVKAKVPKTQARAHHTPGLTKAHRERDPARGRAGADLPEERRPRPEALPGEADPQPAEPRLPRGHRAAPEHGPPGQRPAGDKQFLKNPHPAFHAAEKVIAGEHPLTQKMLNLHLLSKDEHGARYVPYAVVHMHAKPSTKGLPTVRLTEAAGRGDRLPRRPTTPGRRPTRRRASADRPTATRARTRGVQAALNKAKASQEEGQGSSRASPERHLTVDEIKAHMQNPANHNGDGDGTGVLLPAPGATGKRVVLQGRGGPQHEAPRAVLATARVSRRLQGTHDADVEALVAQRAHSENASRRPRATTRSSRSTGRTRTQAGQPAVLPQPLGREHRRQELSQKVGVDLVPVNVGHAKAIQDLLDTGKLEHQTTWPGSPPGCRRCSATPPRPVHAGPADAEGQAARLGPPEGQGSARVAEEFTKHWKASILTTSTHWPAGNAIDLGTRSWRARRSARPGSCGGVLHRKVKQVAPAAYDEMRPGTSRRSCARSGGWRRSAPRTHHSACLS
jgi:hypothetical protein